MKIFINDFTLDIYFQKKFKRIVIPFGMIKDGRIRDFNYIYYIMKKFLRENHISHSERVSLILNSKNNIFIKRKVPDISYEDQKSMLYYEIKESTPYEIDEYYYEFIKEGEFACIFMVKKQILDEYLELFEKLKLKVISFNTLNDYFFKSGNVFLLFFNLTNTVLSLNSDTKIMSQFVNEHEMYDFIEKTNLDYENIKYILFEKEIYNAEVDIKKYRDFLDMDLKNRLNSLYFTLRKYNYDIILSGDFMNENVKNLIENSFPDRNIEYIEEIPKFTDINFIKKKKFEIKIQYIFIFILIFLNCMLSFFINDKYKAAKIENEKIVTCFNKEKSDLNSLKPKKVKRKVELLKKRENKKKKTEKLNSENQKFLNYVTKFSNLNSDEIYITEFEFKNSKIYIVGFARNEDILHKIFKDYNYEIISTNEKELLNFKLLIEA